jgi:hypothetical protein
MVDSTIPITAAWLMFAVTNTGQVSSAGFPSRAACEDAVNIAQNGMTVAESKKFYEESRVAQEKRKAEWEKAHPPREPRSEEELSAVRDFSQDRVWINGIYSFHVLPGGLIQDDEPVSSNSSSVSVVNTDDIATRFTTIRCFPNPDKP